MKKKVVKKKHELAKHFRIEHNVHLIVEMFLLILAILFCSMFLHVTTCNIGICSDD